MYYPNGPYMDHGVGWWFFAAVMPLLLFGLLVALIVWAVLHFNRTPGSNALPPPPPPPGPRMDPALEEVRLRYARGEMSREEFLERFRDLGGAHPEPPPPASPPATSPPAASPPAASPPAAENG